MKTQISYFVSLLLIGISSVFFGACSDEDELTPSGNDFNYFIPDDDDHSPEAELRRSFYDETGIYLLFSDTLRHIPNGVNAYGETVYQTERINFNYNLTGNNNYTLRITYYTSIDEMEEAVRQFKQNYLSHMGKAMQPYSILLVRNLQNDEYGDDWWEEIGYVSNLNCTGIAVGDVYNMSDYERERRITVTLNGLVDEALDELSKDLYFVPFYDVVPDEIADAYLGELIPGWDRTQMEALYELGYIDYSEDWYDDTYYDQTPSDWDDFIKLVLETPWEDLEAQWGQYDRIMQKLEIAREAILAAGYIF